MSKFLVSGSINMETTLKINSFPINYTPVNYPFFGINSSVSGVGFNISKALTTLGDEVNFLSIIGDDYNGEIIQQELAKNNIGTKYIKKIIKDTLQSIILYDDSGKREIFLDLKDIQKKQYPEQEFEKVLAESEVVILANINFSRHFIKKAKASGKIIATDVHTLSKIEDEYNKEFLTAADILFLSDENINGPIEEFVKKIANKFGNKIIVVGLGKIGALLYVKKDKFIGRFKAVQTREVINTIGAGDALFSSFLHTYTKTKDPYLALKRAIVFASYKIGETGAANGFLTDQELDKWCKQLYTKKLPF